MSYVVIEGSVRQMDLDTGEARIQGKFTGTVKVKARKGTVSHDRVKKALVTGERVMIVTNGEMVEEVHTLALEGEDDT